MRTYLPHDILDVPFAIIDHAGALTRDRELLLRAFSTHESQLPLRPAELASIRLRPHILADAIGNDLLSPSDEVSALAVAPATLFRVMALDPDKFFPRLSPALLKDAESIERIIAMASERSLRLPGPLSVYKEMLRGDPNRYHRVLDAEERSREITDLVEAAKKTSTAASAFFALRCEATAPLPSPGLMAGEQSYAYLLAKLLRGRGVHRDVWKQYVDVVREPRWVFHVLRDGLVQEGADSDSFLDRLAEDAAWLVEYLRRSHSTPATRIHWAREAITRNETLREDVELWLRSTSIRDLVSHHVAVARHDRPTAT